MGLRGRQGMPWSPDGLSRKGAGGSACRTWPRCKPSVREDRASEAQGRVPRDVAIADAHVIVVFRLLGFAKTRESDMKLKYLHENNSGATNLFRPKDPVTFPFHWASGRIPVTCPLSLFYLHFRFRFRLRFWDGCGLDCCSPAKSTGTSAQHNSDSG